jgi:membrane protease YdiL (CAAX protease family)
MTANDTAGGTPDEATRRSTLWTRIWRRPGGLRAGWRLAGFTALFAAFSYPLVWATLWLWPAAAEVPGWAPLPLTAAEAISLVAVLAALAAVARLERRPWSEYGLPLRHAFGRRFWEGSLWGLAAISAVIGLIALADGFTVLGLAIHGAEIVRWGLAWLVPFLLVGLYEEIFFRTYPAFALARGMGFWGGALMLSAVFGALHYFTKPQESWMDAAGTALVALFLYMSLRRTGNVWFAIGFHFAFNFGSFFLYGGPNTGNEGQPLTGHLLDSLFYGPRWLTGGPTGPESSVFMFVVLAAAFAALHFRFREVRFRPESSVRR